MPKTPSSSTNIGSTLSAYMPLGKVMSAQSRIISDMLGRDRTLIKIPIGIIPVGDVREHTEIRAREQGFGIFSGSGNKRRSLLSATIDEDGNVNVVGGEMKGYTDE